MALSCAVDAVKKNEAFKVAMAVAPVTDWMYYDSAYTERYMRTPLNNRDGYKKTSVIDRINSNSFNKTHVLISHGTADGKIR